jgi:hypothetical protein
VVKLQAIQVPSFFKQRLKRLYLMVHRGRRYKNKERWSLRSPSSLTNDLTRTLQKAKPAEHSFLPGATILSSVKN